jgi:insulysin
MVQSNSHQPEDLLYRFELFFEEYLQTIQTQIDPQRFNNLKATSIHSLQTRFRNLKDKAGLWNLLAFEKGADFNYIEKRIAALEALSYENFCAFVNRTLSRSNLKRLAVFFEGRLNAPFAYETIDTPKLLEISRYEAKPVAGEGLERTSQ